MTADPDPQIPAADTPVAEQQHEAAPESREPLPQHVIERVVNPSITGLREDIDGIVRALLLDLAATPPGAVVDLHAAYSRRLPGRVLAELFGVLPQQRETTVELMDAAANTTASGAEQHTLWEAMYLLVEAKQPSSDELIGRLLVMREWDAAALPTVQVVATLIQLVMAGIPTTTALITAAVRDLAADPVRLRRARADDAQWAEITQDTLRRHRITHLPGLPPEGAERFGIPLARDTTGAAVRGLFATFDVEPVTAGSADPVDQELPVRLTYRP
ncbi:cytochrome P450 family protein [Streptomyces millisiae]|uniref:Uncharacterized protein n=1 Tax=Streptomyces millisiae TaxID=3075542 RepID=A0ABU2LWD7_9ACTN|nr:hypothetical protein [Streptomyces sp. DSM 44918]MDT0321884.1 hypothetical protein [Streptomyces sp. DSM 44918]